MSLVVVTAAMFRRGGLIGARRLAACSWFSTKTYPYHIVMGMPALSPTMDRGTLASWNVQVGSKFLAGDALARIETDKASIDFEAQDDGFVAKLLVGESTPDILVGTPILVTVEEEDHVGAFANFVVEEETPVAAPVVEAPPVTAAAAPPPVSTPPPPPPPPAASVAPPPPPPAAPAPVATATAAPPPPPPPSTPVSSSTQGPSWGNKIQRKSPIAKTLSASQKAYIDKYGTTGQIPI